MTGAVIPFRNDPAKITVRLVETFFQTRWPCHVCGGSTEKVAILAEAADGKIRVCETCLKAGDIDARLEEHAAALERSAAEVRKLIGRLVVPTYAAWRATCVGHDRDLMRDIGMSEAEIAEAEAAQAAFSTSWARWTRLPLGWQKLPGRAARLFS